MGLTQLEILYDFEPKRLEYIDRKFKITQKRLIIQAPFGSGITFLLYSHMLNYNKNERLYINMEDFRIDKELLGKTLQDFLDYNKIKLLILDNFNFDMPIPNCEEILISTKKRGEFIVDGFDKKRFYPLDFEEYIAFEKRYANIEHIFNNYAKNGTFPSVCLSPDIDRFTILNNIIKKFATNQKELTVLKEFVKFQSKKVSLYTVFKTIKNSIKISKDSFYEIAQAFSDMQLLIFIEKYNSPKSQKKLFLLDFAIKNILIFEKDFLKRFENIVLLELYKREKEVYYTEEIDFYLPSENIGILCIPFLPTNLLKNKIVKRKKAFKKLGIKKIQIISLGNEDKFVDSDIEYEILPFWNWALILDT